MIKMDVILALLFILACVCGVTVIGFIAMVFADAVRRKTDDIFTDADRHREAEGNDGE